jgi:hypothetical protein
LGDQIRKDERGEAYRTKSIEDKLLQVCSGKKGNKQTVANTQIGNKIILNLSNPIFLPPAYSPSLIYFGRERGWWITCNYPTVLKEKNINRKSTTCAIC